MLKISITSGSAYHELASLCREMPRHYRLKERITELNSKWYIIPTLDGTTESSAMIEGTPNCMSRATGALKPYCMYVCMCETCVCVCVTCGCVNTWPVSQIDV